MDIKQKITDLFKEGKSVDDIISYVTDNLDKFEGASKTSAEIMSIITHAKLDMKSQMDKNKKSSDLKSDLQKASVLSDVKQALLENSVKLEKSFDEKLKSIKIGSKEFSDKWAGKEKIWDPVFKKSIDPNESVLYHPMAKKFQDAIRCMVRKDWSSARAIDKEIIEEEQKQYGKKLVSNITDADGGVTIPTIVESQIIQYSEQESVVLRFAKTDNIIVNDKIYPTFGQVTFAALDDEDDESTESPSTGQFKGITVDMHRIGAHTLLSNTILSQNINIMPTIVTGYGHGRARYIDLVALTGHVNHKTAGSDPQVENDQENGLVFKALDPEGDDSVSYVEGASIAIDDLDINSLTKLKQNINQRIDESRTIWIASTAIQDKIGLLERTGGDPFFRGYIENGSMRPFGREFIRSINMSTTLDFTARVRTTGVQSALILADMSKFIFGSAGGMKMRTSEHFKITSDQTTLVGFERFGWELMRFKVADGTIDTAGPVRVLKVTN